MDKSGLSLIIGWKDKDCSSERTMGFKRAENMYCWRFSFGRRWFNRKKYDIFCVFYSKLVVVKIILLIFAIEMFHSSLRTMEITGF